MRNIFRLLCAVLLCGAVSTPTSAQYLSEDELTRLMAGTTIEGTNRDDFSYFMRFNADASLEIRIEKNISEFLDDGKWWTEESKDGAAKLCYQFEVFSKGRVRCRSYAIENDGRTLGSYYGDGSRSKRNWVITRPGPQASAVIAAKKATRIAGAPQAAQRSAPPAPRPFSRRSPTAPAPPVQRPLTAAQDTQPPVIDVPATIAAKGAVAAIAGQIRDASRLIEVTIDGRPVAVGADGSFSARRGVPQGTSTITIVALDEWGNRAARSVTLTRERFAAIAPAPVKPKTTAKPRPNPFAGIHFGRYKALVIGNNNYRDMPKLKTAVNDARAVAKLLTDDYGFDTKLLIDATRGDIFTELGRLRAKLMPDDNLLIYYAGHGVLDEIGQQGYWLPVDAENDIQTNWISNSDITTTLRAIRAKHVMVVADSCYSGTLVRAAAINIKTAAARRAWVSRMTTKRARTALVSGGLEPVTDQGSGGHSVFASAFLAALRENRDVMGGQSLFDTIKRPVVLNADQTPQYSDIRRAGHDGGEFLFVRR